MKSISEITSIISEYTDEELKILGRQVLRLSETGMTSEQPLRSLIDSYPMGITNGIIAIPTMVMQECTKRWINV